MTCAVELRRANPRDSVHRRDMTFHGLLTAQSQDTVTEIAQCPCPTLFKLQDDIRVLGAIH